MAFPASGWRISNRGSQRALPMLFALRSIQQRTGATWGRRSSGATLSHSLTELYLLFSSCARRNWAIKAYPPLIPGRPFSRSGAETIDYEFSATNEVVQKERFRYFIKVPELAMFYSEITDYRSAEDIGIDRPQKERDIAQYPADTPADGVHRTAGAVRQIGRCHALVACRLGAGGKRRKCSLPQTTPARCRSICV